MAFKLLIFAALVSLSVAQLEVPGRALGRTRSVAPLAFTTACDGKTVYSACSDCNTVLICLGPDSDTRDCSLVSPTTPFCVNGVCSATPDSSAACFPSSLTCTGVGFYPDPKNCQIYHYCEGIGQTSSEYECPPNYVFNAATNLCKKKVSDKDCVKVQCDKSKVFVSYGTSKQFFAYCQYDGNVVTSISMLKCAPYSNFNGLSCVFTCPRVGNFEHPDPAKYYQCYNSGGRLVYLVQNCSAGRVFDKDLQVCLSPPPTTTTTTTPATTTPAATTTTPTPTTTTTTAAAAPTTPEIDDA